MATATVMNGANNISSVELRVTGYGSFIFTMEKFPSHCGATILHNMAVRKNQEPTKDEGKAYAEVTEWLLTNRREEMNFRRSRIIAADNKNGFIAKLAYYSDEWNHSNPVINKQTNREIAFYWLDKR